jgi:hypothetical protein
MERVAAIIEEADPDLVQDAANRHEIGRHANLPMTQADWQAAS